MWLFNSSILILIGSIILFLFTSRFFIFLLRKNQWCTILYVIFLVGGLIVTFFYIVRINHNNFKNFKFRFMYFIISILSIFWIVPSFYVNHFFFYNLINLKLNRIFINWKERQSYYLTFIIIILLYLIIIIIFVDKKLKLCKSRIKEW